MTKAIGHICVSFFSLSNAFRIEKYVSNERHSLSDYVWFILREVTEFTSWEGLGIFRGARILFPLGQGGGLKKFDPWTGGK